MNKSMKIPGGVIKLRVFFLDNVNNLDIIQESTEMTEM